MKKERIRKGSILAMTTALVLVLVFCFAGSVWADDINKQIAKSSIIDKVVRKASCGSGCPQSCPGRCRTKRRMDRI